MARDIVGDVIDRIDRASDPDAVDDLFLKLGLWVERSFVLNRSTGDEELQQRELSTEMLQSQLTPEQGKDLTSWLSSKLTDPSRRSGALWTLAHFPGDHVIRPLLRVVTMEPRQAASWKDSDVESLLRTMAFRIGETTLPENVSTLSDALVQWVEGRGTKARELADDLVAKCKDLRSMKR